MVKFLTTSKVSLVLMAVVPASLGLVCYNLLKDVLALEPFGRVIAFGAGLFTLFVSFCLISIVVRRYGGSPQDKET